MKEYIKRRRKNTTSKMTNSRKGMREQIRRDKGT